MGAWYTIWQGTVEGSVQQRRHDNAKRPEVRGEKRAFNTDQRIVKSVVIGVWAGGLDRAIQPAEVLLSIHIYYIKGTQYIYAFTSIYKYLPRSPPKDTLGRPHV
jgi:hypothetical protein